MAKCHRGLSSPSPTATPMPIPTRGMQASSLPMTLAKTQRSQGMDQNGIGREVVYLLALLASWREEKTHSNQPRQQSMHDPSVSRKFLRQPEREAAASGLEWPQKGTRVRCQYNGSFEARAINSRKDAKIAGHGSERHRQRSCVSLGALGVLARGKNSFEPIQAPLHAESFSFREFSRANATF